MKRRIILLIFVIIIGVILAGGIKWMKDSSSRIQITSGGKTYELVEKWVSRDSFGLSADSAWFPTSVKIFPELAKELDSSEVIPFNNDMVLKSASAFGSQVMTKQTFSLYDGQLNKVDVSRFADLPGLKSGDYYLVVDAAWGFSFYRTGYQYIGKIALP